MAKKDIGVGVIGVGMGSTMFPLNRMESSRFEVRGICSQYGGVIHVDIFQSLA